MVLFKCRRGIEFRICEVGIGVNNVKSEGVYILFEYKDYFFFFSYGVVFIKIKRYVMCKMYIVIKYGYWWNILFNILMGKKEIRIFNLVIFMILKINFVLL